MRKIMGLLVMILFLAACGTGGDTAVPESGTPRVLTLMTHDSFAISEDVLQAFEAKNDVTVEILPSGDAGAALNQAILAKDNPLADLFFGVDNTFMSRALEADIFEAYDSPALADIRADLKLDETNRLLPVDYGDVCLNYDKAWFAAKGLPVPVSWEDLRDPAYKGLLVVENPATSSPGLAFMLATVAAFGADDEYDFLDYWADLRANEVLVTNGWEDAYYGQFTVGGGGERPLVVSYASSPPAEFIFADPPADESPTASITAPGMCFRQVEFVGILKGTESRDLAEKFVDFMLGQTFQEDIPLNMFVFPANEPAALPQEFTDWAQIPDQPATLPPDEIAANRDAWIEAWTEIVLR